MQFPFLSIKCYTHFSGTHMMAPSYLNNYFTADEMTNKYRCNICHMPGHFIHECPAQQAHSQGFKRTTGIPRSFLEPADQGSAVAAAALGSSVKVNPQGAEHCSFSIT